MKLLPLILFIILLFVAGFVFLQIRRSPRDLKLLGALIIPLFLLFLLSGLLFAFVGKIALLIGITTLAILLLAARKKD
ncbi:MAG: hypothetical protein AB1638_08130 [Nitrospirota bacterium]